MNTGLRFEKQDNPYDAFSEKAKYVNFGVRADTARWTSSAKNVSAKFGHNSYVTNGQQDLSMKFNGSFTASFWAKFPTGGLGLSSLTPTVFAVVLPDTTVSYTISAPDTAWHYYTITRDANDVITLRIDGTTVTTGTSSQPFDLMNDSFIILGNKQRHYTGYDVIADDIIIVDGLLWKQDFDMNLPTDYIDLSVFRQYLYIVVSTGEVWGYSLDS